VIKWSCFGARAFQLAVDARCTTAMYLSTLPVIFFILITVGFHKRYRQGWRDSLLRSAVTWGATATLLAEILGAFRLLHRTGLVISWSLACLIAAVWVSRNASGHPVPPASNTTQRSSELVALAPVLVGAALLAASVALAAFLSPPGPIDVHLYHMPRVLFWLQHRSLGHYPTVSHQQLFMPPWAELAALHLYALAGDDRFVNFVHFASYVGCGIAASSVGRLLGGSVTAQATAAVFVLSLPQAVLTASGSKNDLTVAFWILTAVYFALSDIRNQRIWNAPFLALATALAIFTKATAYVWLPFILLTIYLSHGRDGAMRLLRSSPIIAGACLLLNAGHYARNLATFGSPWGCDAANCGTPYKFVNAHFGPRSAAANVIRNLCLHATTPIPAANQRLYEVAVSAIRLLGVDPQDGNTVWFGTRFEPPQYRLHEAVAGNPVHLALIVGATLLLACTRKPRAKTARAVTVAAVLSFIGFCWLFRWQPWHARMHLPFFVLMAPVIGAVVELLAWPILGSALSIVLLMQAFSVAMANEIRPIANSGWNLFTVSREQLYPHAEHVRALAARLKQAGCRNVALDVHPSFEIYPLLRSLGVGSSDVRASYIVAEPRFERWYGETSLKPCAVIYTHCDASWRSDHCRALGPPQRFGELWLVMGFQAEWSVRRGWQIGAPGNIAPQESRRDVDIVTIPAHLKADRAEDRGQMEGVAPDRWVTEKGISMFIAAKKAREIKVRLVGDVPVSGPVLPQGILLRCGDRGHHRQLIEKQGRFDFTITLRCPSEEVTRLVVLPERSFRPRELGINDDPRQLAFRVFELAISKPQD